VSRRVAATLGFLEKLTLEPEEVARADADAVRAAGVSDEALVDAIHICALFSMIVRLADALGWEIPTYESFFERADAMLAGGYALESG
jgi:alkylhydroperoxidase family enzyme